MNTYSNLPEGVEELLYPQSREFELLRRKILDAFHSWGFEYIEPPIIEYLDALLVGNGKDLQLQTFQIVRLFTKELLLTRYVPPGYYRRG